MDNPPGFLGQEWRPTYLIEWRKGLWTQIRQKEDAIWRFMSFYGGALVVAVSLLQGVGVANVEVSGWLSIVLTVVLVSLWGVAIVLDANYWMRHNLILIGNIERELLDRSDLGVLLPRVYADPPRFRYSRGYQVHLVVLLCSLVLAVLGCAKVVLSEPAAFTHGDLVLLGLTACVFSGGLLYVFRRDRERYDDWVRTERDAPGRDPSPREYPELYDLVRFRFQSPVTGVGGWLLSFLGAKVFLLAASLVNPWGPIPRSVRFCLSVGLLGLGTLGFVVVWIVSEYALPLCRERLKALANASEKRQEPHLLALARISGVVSRLRKLSLWLVLLSWLTIVTGVVWRLLLQV